MKKSIGIIVVVLITLSFEIKGINEIVVTGSFLTCNEKEITLSSTYPDNPINLTASIKENGSFVFRFTVDIPAYYLLNSDITLNLFLLPGDSIHIVKIDGKYLFSGGESSTLCNYLQDTVWQQFILSNRETNEYFSLEPEDFYQSVKEYINSCQVPLSILRTKYPGLNNEFIRLENEKQKYRWLRDIYVYEYWTGRESLDQSFYDRIMKDVDLNDNSLLQLVYFQDFLLYYLNYYANRYLQEYEMIDNEGDNLLNTRLKIIDSLFTNSDIIDFLYYKTFLNTDIDIKLIAKFKYLNSNKFYLKQLENRLMIIDDYHSALDSVNNLQSSENQICNEYIEEIIQEYVKEFEFMGAVLIAKEDSIVHLKSYGFADLDKKIPNSINTNYYLASVSKLFTRAAIVMLKDKGLLALDDPISKYISDYPNGDKISIKNLIEHTSGIVDYRNELPLINEIDYMDIDHVIEKFKYEPINFEPGTKYSYCNSGYVLLAYIIEKVSGMTYNDYIEKNIFNVLNMNNSYASWETEPENRAVGYTKQDGFYIPCDKIHMSQLIGTGSLSSSIEDMYLWYKGIYRTNQISTEYQMTGINAQTGRGSCCMSVAFGIVQQQDFIAIVLSNYKDVPMEKMLREFMSLLQKL